LLILLLIGCNSKVGLAPDDPFTKNVDVNSLSKSANPIHKIPEIIYRNGYLEFASEEVFKKYYESELPLPDEIDRQFTSMMDVYREVMRAYEGVFSKFEMEPRAKIDKYLPFTSSLMIAKDYDANFARLLIKYEGSIRLVDDGEGGHLVKHRALGDRAAELCNAQGIVKVGNIIRQFGDDYYKAILDGDASKIANLNQFTSTSQVERIFVSPVIYNGRPMDAAGRVIPLNECTNSNGNNRTIMNEVMVNNQNEFARGGFHYRVEMYARYRPLGVFAFRPKQTCQLSINSGTFTSNWLQGFGPQGYPNGFTNYGSFFFNDLNVPINQTTRLSGSGFPFTCSDFTPVDPFVAERSCCGSPPVENFSEKKVTFAISSDIFGTPTVINATFNISGRGGTGCIMSR
jgi:hypothetical protein